MASKVIRFHDNVNALVVCKGVCKIDALSVCKIDALSVDVVVIRDSTGQADS